MMLPSLYPHQEKVRDAIRASLSKHRASILCAQTGFGKSRVAKWILAKSLEKPNGQYLLAVHRRGLVDNLAKNLDESPAVPYGVIMSGEETTHDARLQLASIDSLLAWYVDGDHYSGPLFDMVIFDEAHSHLPKLRTFMEAHNKVRSARGLLSPYLLGLTATPRCEGLADVFGDIVMGPTAEWLQEKGFAARYRYMAGRKGRLDLLQGGGSDGEYSRESRYAAMEGLAGDFVRDWKQYAQGRPTVGFFPRRSHAKEAMVFLNESGVSADYVDGETGDDERRRLYHSLDSGGLDYLCNVGVVERGTDIPACACVQLCTATGSLVRYRQMIGRGSRVAKGKTDTLVLDHGGNIARHGFFEDEIAWTLDRTTQPTREHVDRPPVECPQCHRLYRGGRCEACGYEPTAREMKAQGLSFDGRPLEEVQREKRKEVNATPEAEFGRMFFACGHMTLAQVGRIIQRKHQVIPKYMQWTSGNSVRRFELPWGTQRKHDTCKALRREYRKWEVSDAQAPEQAAGLF